MLESIDKPAKLGLALSGGGFRAAYFHIGVLARLAERGLLRPIEVISTVSGGSIVGALYYLHLKNLLESFEPREIQDEHYVLIVKHIAESFHRAVRRNLRANVVLHPLRIFRTAALDYSRTDLIGELYEQWLYQHVWEGHGPIPVPPEVLARRGTPIEMRSLVISPPDKPSFDPDIDNEGRAAKVPILLLNAATLNTGHGWRFEAMYMGELDPHADPHQPHKHKESVRTPDPARDEIDKNTTLARTRYADMPERKAMQRLGTAVAASSAFPGLFRPFEIHDLFARGPGRAERIDVKLMDGGAHDNQGVEALLDRGCNRFIVSDASQQMADKDRPPMPLPALLSRANSLYSDRVRELQLGETIYRSIAFMHLQKELASDVLYPYNPPAKLPPTRQAGPAGTHTSFGVEKGVQRRLAGIRTDLDSFSEIESRSLMNDGYLMTATTLDAEAHTVAALGTPTGGPSEGWSFSAIDPWMKAPTSPYERRLDAAKSHVFKPVFLWPRLARYLAGVVAVLALGGALFGIWRLWTAGTSLSGAWVAIAVFAVSMAALLYVKPDIPLLRYLGALVYERTLPLLLGLVTCLLFVPLWAAIRLSNWLFLWLGNQERLGGAAR